MDGVNEGSWLSMTFRTNNVPDAAMKGGERDIFHYSVRCHA